MTANALMQTQIIEKAWQDEDFKQRLISNPKETLKEAFGILFPDSLKIKTVEESTDEIYLVIPRNPAEQFENKARMAAPWD
ncbi:NHLP leader peptide family RiPP precursor [Paenibacillus thailandensis]|uniref:NHLP leader peptide family RiPP n=1 Tax=Paenibacillus thailandensis TaxID=393250 RepID=A0ABW5QW10_9BACL